MEGTEALASEREGAQLLRTHEGLIPAIAAQIDTSPELLAHTSRFAKIYKGLAAYRKCQAAAAATHGHPVARHLFLHYPHDCNVYGLRYQYLLRPDLMIAPVVDKEATSVEVYWPEGTEWIDH